MAGRKSRIVTAPRDDVRVRRSYFECRYGQLHVRTAFPSSGGFDEHTTLLCFHGARVASRTFAGFLPLLALNRSVYAPDAPGCGESDPADGRPAIADYAAAMVDFIDSMRLRRVDVLGHGPGSLLAAELALQKPEHVRRIVMVSLPAPSTTSRQVKAEEQEAPEAAQAREVPSGDYTDAAGRYPAAERLALLRQPVLVLRSKDDQWESALHLRQLFRGARVTELTETDGRLFDVSAPEVARYVREFLDAPPR